MAIKEPVMYYRKYQVTPSVEYLPCLPTKDFPFTRIPRGSEIIFVHKIDNILYEVEFVDPMSENRKPCKVIITSMGFEFMLPLYKRNI